MNNSKIQMHETDKETEVLIVGAGPAGLMMACQLAIQGIPFRIIDKKLQPTSNSGALIIQARSIEIFDQMGLAQKAINEGIVANNINFQFNGKHLFKMPVNNIGSGLSRFPFLLMIKQSKTEQLLTEFINKHGFSIERGYEFLNFKHDPTGVTAEILNPNGKIESIKTQFIIAADGGKSTIRQQLNIPFIGKEHHKSLFIIDCKTDTKLSEDEIYISFSDKTISGFFPLSNGKWRIDGTIPKELESKETLTFDDIEKHFSERIRIEMNLYDPEWFSVFHSHQHHAASFQKDRCFLIGDAAHIHSPVGAQGMNSGLQDAHNLSWKLAFVLRGKAKSGLLNTYTPERLPVARNTTQSTDTIFNLLTSEALFKKAFRIYLLPFIIKTLFPFITGRQLISRYLFKSISQTGIHYRESALSRKPSISFLPSNALRPGDRLPFILFSENGDEVNIQDKVKGTSYHLFVFSKKLPSKEIINKLENYSNTLTFEIILHSASNKNLFKALKIKHQGFLLIRPDLHIALQTDTLNFKQLSNYLNQFLTT